MANQGGTHKGAGHRQRLREKFLQSGLLGFHDYEVIELLLSLNTPRKDCKGPAKAALERFKSFQGVLEASPKALCDVDGIGPKNLFGLKLAKAVTDRYLKKKLINADPISNSKDLFNYLAAELRDKQRERFSVVFLDAKNKVLSIETLFEGTLTASSVYPREVVREALDRHAAAVIFAHNHPSGDPKPSAEDLAITRRMIFALTVTGITVHEHLIIAGDCYFSFADQGYIAKIKRDYQKEVPA